MHYNIAKCYQLNSNTSKFDIFFLQDKLRHVLKLSIWSSLIESIISFGLRFIIVSVRLQETNIYLFIIIIFWPKRTFLTWESGSRTNRQAINGLVVERSPRDR